MMSEGVKREASSSDLQDSDARAVPVSMLFSRLPSGRPYRVFVRLPVAIVVAVVVRLDAEECVALAGLRIA